LHHLFLLHILHPLRGVDVHWEGRGGRKEGGKKGKRVEYVREIGSKKRGKAEGGREGENKM